ncbi:MAG: hypothetical protein JSU72_18790 [Deltaproteobacteria bacterium]|nr:MAG: hypothetical protein JSU72_18790 [Deltaproteobacteria bacterium]
MSFPKFLTVWLAILLVFSIMSVSATTAKTLDTMSDSELFTWAEQANQKLVKLGYEFAIGEIEFFTIGLGRPDDNGPKGRVLRILQEPCRWAAYDPLRAPAHDNLTWLYQDTWGSTASGISEIDTGAAIRRAMKTWDSEKCLAKIDIDEVPYLGGDVTILDVFGFCPIAADGFGNFLAADIVIAGWYPAVCFGPLTLGMTVTFVSLDRDINGDNYADTIHVETYYNDLWFWAIDALLPFVDTETTVLHEAGHALGIGHFGPPPVAVMNPVYGGLEQSPLPIDRAGMCTMFARWPE